MFTITHNNVPQRSLDQARLARQRPVVELQVITLDVVAIGGRAVAPTYEDHVSRHQTGDLHLLEFACRVVV